MNQSGASSRQVVPRWRRWRLTALLGELATPASRGRRSLKANLKGFLKSYELEPNEGRLGDLIGAAAVSAERTPEILRAAETASHAKGPVLAKSASTLLEGDHARLERANELEATDSEGQIRTLRRILTREPRNAVRWVDLAREYTILGLNDKSERALRIAIHLAPNDRFVLRCAAAYFAHLEDYQEAAELLAGSSATPNDPWLCGASVAVSDLAAMKLPIRPARKLLHADVPNRSIAELQAALGTVEVLSGSARRGRQLLRQSLTDPTENALAQVEWLLSTGTTIDAELTKESVPRRYEAEALRMARAGKWVEALNSAEHWFADQPFSADAASHASFYACEAEMWEKAERVAQAGLRANPSQAILLNNKAYAQARMGRLEDAVRALLAARSLNPSGEALLALVATEGLVLLKAGYIGEGRRRYVTAIEGFSRLADRDTAAKAALLLLQEEIALATPRIDDAWAKALGLSEGSDDVEVVQLIRRISRLPRGRVGTTEIHEPVDKASVRPIIDEPPRVSLEARGSEHGLSF